MVCPSIVSSSWKLQLTDNYCPLVAVSIVMLSFFMGLDKLEALRDCHSYVKFFYPLLSGTPFRRCPLIIYDDPIHGRLYLVKQRSCEVWNLRVIACLKGRHSL